MQSDTHSNSTNYNETKVKVPESEKLERLISARPLDLSSQTSLKQQTQTLPGQVSPSKNGDKDILTALERTKPKAGAQHVNNKPKALAVFGVFGGILVILGAMGWLGKYQQPTSVISRNATLTAAAVVLPTERNVNIGGLVTHTAIPSPTAYVVQIQVVTATLSPPTQTPWVITAVPVVSTALIDPAPIVYLSIQVYWPKKGWWDGAKLKSGVSPTLVEGYAVACPDRFPLGTWFVLNPSGFELLCLDRSKNLACSGGICNVVLYSRDSRYSGVWRAKVELPPVDWTVK